VADRTITRRTPQPELSLPRAYATVIASRVRSQVSYRSSFAVQLVNAFVLGIAEFAEIYVILANVPTLGGLTLGQAALVFGLANFGFSIADLIFGSIDQTPTHIQRGTLETFLIRPLPVLGQLITADFQLRRLGRASFGVLVVVVVLLTVEIDYTAASVYLLIVTPLVGAAIYGALFVLAGGVQFWLINGAEFTNSFVYGSSYASQLPGSVLMLPLRVLFTFVFPATVASYLPSLLILGLPGPPWLPAWLGWFAPLFAAWTWLLAWLAWRLGVRHYTGAGG
jgi:ABC-2 type transport system permease protein